MIPSVIPILKWQSVSTIGATRKPEDRTHLLEKRSPGRSMALFWSAFVNADGWSGPATILEISADGLGIRSQLNPEVGANVAVELPGVDTFRGEVRWSNNGWFGVRLDHQINVVDVMRAHRAATGSHLGIDLKA